MDWFDVLILVVAILAGGAAGYLYGSKVQRKAEAVLGSAKQAAAGVATAADAAVETVKKAF